MPVTNRILHLNEATSKERACVPQCIQPVTILVIPENHLVIPKHIDVHEQVPSRSLACNAHAPNDLTGRNHERVKPGENPSPRAAPVSTTVPIPDLRT